MTYKHAVIVLHVWPFVGGIQQRKVQVASHITDV